MKRVIQSMMCAVVLCVGAQAMADDMEKGKDSSGMMSKDDMMKDCMKEQKSMSPSMSKADMKKACDDKMMKMDKDKGMMKDGMKK